MKIYIVNSDNDHAQDELDWHISEHTFKEIKNGFIYVKNGNNIGACISNCFNSINDAVLFIESKIMQYQMKYNEKYLKRLINEIRERHGVVYEN